MEFEKESKQMRHAAEGLLKVLIWKVQGAVSFQELVIIYQEWLKRREILPSEILNTRSAVAFLPLKDFYELLMSYLKTEQQFRAVLPQLCDLTVQIFNSLIVSNNQLQQQIGFDIQGKPVLSASALWLQQQDTLFLTLANENPELTLLSPFHVQFFLLALLYSEINEENNQQMAHLVKLQTQQMLEHMCHFKGFITLRNLKQYLLTQKLRKESELKNLQQNLLEILISFNSTNFPDIIQISVA